MASNIFPAPARPHRKELSRMKELRRIEPRPNSTPARPQASTRREHPLKYRARNARPY